MRFIRPVIRVRSLMVLVLIVGLIGGLFARVREQRRRRVANAALSRIQGQAVSSIVHQAYQDARKIVSESGKRSRSGGNVGGRLPPPGIDGSSPYVSYAFSLAAGPVRRICDLEATVGTSSSGLVLEPILIVDRGGEENPKIVGQIARLCRDRGWAYRVVPGKPSPIAGF